MYTLASCHVVMLIVSSGCSYEEKLMKPSEDIAIMLSGANPKIETIGLEFSGLAGSGFICEIVAGDHQPVQSHSRSISL
ncbi:unnamed protein product [Sphagnum balticum]